MKRSVFIPIPKKDNAKECSNYHTIALISHARKVVLKILQSRHQQYGNRELPHIQTGFRKDRRTEYQIANICWIIEKARKFQKNIYLCFTDYAKAFDYVGQRDGNTRPSNPPPEKPLCRSISKRTRHGIMDWLKNGKGICQSCILPLCSFNLYAEYNVKCQAGWSTSWN